MACVSTTFRPGSLRAYTTVVILLGGPVLELEGDFIISYVAMIEYEGDGLTDSSEVEVYDGGTSHVGRLEGYSRYGDGASQSELFEFWGCECAWWP